MKKVGSLSSIQWHLNFSFGIAAFLVSLLICIIIGIVAYQRIINLEHEVNQITAYRLSQLLIQSYETTGNWRKSIQWIKKYNQKIPEHFNQNIQLQFQWQLSLATLSNQQRILLLDPQHRVIFDSHYNLRPHLSAPGYEIALQRVGQKERFGFLVVKSGMTYENTRQALYYALFFIFLLSFGLALGVNLFVSLFLSHRIIKPLNKLSQASHALANAESIDKLPVYGKDEISLTTQAFNIMLDALKEQKRLRQQMMMDIAHELRTPLSIIRLEIEAMQDGMQNIENGLITTTKELTYLTYLINDLRYLSLADAGELSLDKHFLPLVTLFKQFEQRWSVVTKKYDIKFEVKLPREQYYIFADINRLQQALNNLISNAIRYTPPQGTIQLSAKIKDKNYQLILSDTGSGIPDTELAYIFNRFYYKNTCKIYKRTHTLNQLHMSSGLGLAIAQQIISLHKGKIWAKNRLPEKGMSFYIQLPK